MMGEMWQRVLIAMALGALAGYLLGPIVETASPRLNSQIIEWLALPGNLFLQLLRFLVVPLVAVSVVLGIAKSDRPVTSGRIGVGMVIYFLVTTTVALIIGVGVAGVIAPGQWLDVGLVGALLEGSESASQSAQPGTIPDILVNLIASNPVAMLVRDSLLQIFVGSAILGFALGAVAPKQKEILLEVLEGLRAAFMNIVAWLMRLAPLAVFGLMAQLIANLGAQAFFGLVGFVSTVLLALAVLVIVYGLLLKMVAQRPLQAFLKAAADPILIAFSSTSSAATLPVTLKTSEEKLGISPITARLVIPLGATFNTDGSVVFQAVVVMFLAQVFGHDIGLAELAILLGLTFATSFQAPGLPGGAIPIIAVMLTALGIPAEGLALVIAVDRFLDMFRTSLNVTGDMVAAAVIDRLAGAGGPRPQS